MAAALITAPPRKQPYVRALIEHSALRFSAPAWSTWTPGMFGTVKINADEITAWPFSHGEAVLRTLLLHVATDGFNRGPVIGDFTLLDVDNRFVAIAVLAALNGEAVIGHERLGI